MRTVTIHDQLYEVPSWAEVGDFSFQLAQKIQSSGKTYNRLVALARGGVSITQSLSDLLSLKRISVIQTELYTGINEKASAPVIVQPLSASIVGESILLVDDLADSGETLLFAKQYLGTFGPTYVDTATIACKPWTKIIPDYSVVDTNAWIVFPWEVRETIVTLTALWTKKGDTLEQVRANLTKCGYTQLQIETYSKS